MFSSKTNSRAVETLLEYQYIQILWKLLKADGPTAEQSKTTLFVVLEKTWNNATIIPRKLSVLI